MSAKEATKLANAMITEWVKWQQAQLKFGLGIGFSEESKDYSQAGNQKNELSVTEVNGGSAERDRNDQNQNRR